MADRIRTDQSAEMTTGALIYALDNEQIDYVGMALWNAKNIYRHLGIPCAIATDSNKVNATDNITVIPIQTNTAQTKFFQDYNCSLTWHNGARPTALEITPWSRTLLLDADYVVASDFLGTMLASDESFLCYRSALDVAGQSGLDFDNINHFGRHGFPQWWATVMIFNKDDKTKYIFDLMKLIQDNWTHYCNLFGITKCTFRNDYALSIALTFVHGHSTHTTDIPGSMLSVMPDHRLTVLQQDIYEVHFKDSQQIQRRTRLAGVDFHAMCKADLGRIIENTV